jgi:hypothetical protein
MTVGCTATTSWRTKIQFEKQSRFKNAWSWTSADSQWHWRIVQLACREDLLYGVECVHDAGVKARSSRLAVPEDINSWNKRHEATTGCPTSATAGPRTHRALRVTANTQPSGTSRHVVSWSQSTFQRCLLSPPWEPVTSPSKPLWTG